MGRQNIGQGHPGLLHGAGVGHVHGVGNDLAVGHAVGVGVLLDGQARHVDHGGHFGDQDDGGHVIVNRGPVRERVVGIKVGIVDAGLERDVAGGLGFQRAEDKAPFVQRIRRGAVVGDHDRAVQPGGIRHVGHFHRQIVLDRHAARHRQGRIGHDDRVPDGFAGIKLAVGISIAAGGHGHGFFRADGRQGQAGGADVQGRLGSRRNEGIFAPGARQQGAVAGKDPHAGLVAVGIVDLRGLEEADVRGEIVGAAAVGERSAVAVVVHVDGGRFRRRHPHGAHVGGRRLSGIGIPARRPADEEDRGQFRFRHQAEAPVPRRGRSGIGIDDAQAVEGLPVAVALRVVEQRIRLDDEAVGGNDLVLREDLLAVGVLHDHGDGRRVGIVQDDVGPGVGLGRAHGVVVIAAPLLDRGDGVPIVAIVGIADAGAHVHLNRRRRSDHAAGLDAVGDVQGLPLVQRVRPLERAVAVQIHPHDGAVGHGHDADAGDVEHVAGHHHVFAGGHDVLLAPLARVRYFNRTGQQGRRPGIPAGPGHRHRPRHPDLVPAVPEEVRLHARNRNLLDGEHDLAAGDAIVRRRRAGYRVGAFGRAAVGRIEVAPDFGGALRGTGQIRFVAVLPVVVVDHRIAGEAGNGNHADVPVVRGPRVDGVEERLGAIFVKWQVVGLNDASLQDHFEVLGAGGQAGRRRSQDMGAQRRGNVTETRLRLAGGDDDRGDVGGIGRIPESARQAAAQIDRHVAGGYDGQIVRIPKLHDDRFGRLFFHDGLFRRGEDDFGRRPRHHLIDDDDLAGRTATAGVGPRESPAGAAAAAARRGTGAAVADAGSPVAAVAAARGSGRPGRRRRVYASGVGGPNTKLCAGVNIHIIIACACLYQL